MDGDGNDGSEGRLGALGRESMNRCESGNDWDTIEDDSVQ